LAADGGVVELDFGAATGGAFFFGGIGLLSADFLVTGGGTGFTGAAAGIG
jgi:hypothetical protein